MADGLPRDARKAAEAAYRDWRIGDDGEGRLHAALVAYDRALASEPWRERAEAAEAKLAAIAEYVRSRPSWVVDPVESRLRKDSILAIIGGEGADRG
jgi:hypothetical protein